MRKKEFGWTRLSCVLQRDSRGFWMRILIRNGPVACGGMFTASAVMKTSCHSRFLRLASRVLLGVIHV